MEEVNSSCPTISVLILAYNRKDFLQYAIRSVRQQTLQRNLYEVVAVKNFDFPQYDELVDHVHYRTVYSNEHSMGRFIAEGIKKCKGEIICVLEDDDMWKNEKLQRVYDIFSESHDLVYLHNSVQPINQDGNELTVSRPFESSPVITNDNGFLLIDGSVASSINKSGKYFPDFNLSSISFRKSIVEQHINNVESIDTAIDTFLYMLALQTRKNVLITNEHLTLYRRHRLNQSGSLVNDCSYLDSLHAFTTRAMSAYAEILSWANSTGDRLLIKLCKRRLYFTKVLNVIQAPGKNRIRALSASIALLPYVRYFNPMLNLKAFVLGIFYAFAPLYARQILSDNM